MNDVCIELMLLKLCEWEVDGKIMVLDVEVVNYIVSQCGLNVLQQQDLCFQYIFIKVFINVLQVDIEVVQKKVEVLLQQVKLGVDFEWFVKNNFEVNDVKKGGDFGFKLLSVLLVDVVEVVLKLCLGQVNLMLICVLDGFEIVCFVDCCQSQGVSVVVLKIVQMYVCYILLCVGEGKLEGQVCQ